jgi:hypothetical protein
LARDFVLGVSLCDCESGGGNQHNEQFFCLHGKGLDEI